MPIKRTKNLKKKNTKKKLLKKKLRSPYPSPAIFDYKNAERLKEFLSEKGKIAPRKITGLNARDQRRLAEVVKRARHAGLLPFVHE